MFDTNFGLKQFNAKQSNEIFCNINLIFVILTGYPPMADWLNRTGRPIVYSSVFALHQRVRNIKV